MDFLPKKMIGIDFHDHFAELVELKMSGKEVYLEAYNRMSIPINLIRDGEIKNEKELQGVLTNLLSSANPKAVEGKNVSVVLPSSRTFTHIFSFPVSLSESEIRKAIRYEAETLLPFSMGEVYWDFAVLEKENVKEKHASQFVLFVAIVKRIADQYTQLLESIGLQPYLFSTQVESLKLALQKQLNPKKTMLLIDFGTLSTQYVFFREGVVRYFFSSNIGGVSLLRQLAKEFEVPEGVLIEKQERNRVDERYKPAMSQYVKDIYAQGKLLMSEQETNKRVGPVQTLILTGEFLNLPNFYELAEEAFPPQEIFIGDPKTGLHIDVQKLLPVHQQRRNPVPYSTYFANAIGIGLRALTQKPEEGINILPDRLKESVSHRKALFWKAVGSIAMAAFTLFAGTYLVFKHQALTYERLNLEIQKSAVEKTIYGTRYQDIREEIVRFNQEVSELHQINSNLFSVATVLESLQGMKPEGITLSEIHFLDEKLSIEVVGLADSRETLLAFEQALKELEFTEKLIAPLSNYDEKFQISFMIKLTLYFPELPPYDGSLST